MKTMLFGISLTLFGAIIIGFSLLTLSNYYSADFKEGATTFSYVTTVFLVVGVIISAVGIAISALNALKDKN